MPQTSVAADVRRLCFLCSNCAKAAAFGLGHAVYSEEQCVRRKIRDACDVRPRRS
jgi:hypothetical protein